MNKYDTGLNYRVGVNPNLMQDAFNKVVNERIEKAKKSYKDKLEKLIHESVFKNGTEPKGSIGGLSTIVNGENHE
jgi:hypothetical protein